MKLILILTSLLAIQAAVIADEANCKGSVINGQFFEEEILKRDIDRPYSLAVDYSPNILYFSYNIEEKGDIFKSARLNLNTKEFSNIENINNGFAQAVDQLTHEIYIGGSDGIYKYDYSSKKAVLYAQKGTNIWHLFYKNTLYFSIFPTQFLYTLSDDGNATRYKYLEDTKVDQFAIDNEDDIFFTNATGLYEVKKESKNATLYAENLIIRSLTTDKNGNVYACIQDGIYAVKKTEQSLQKIVSIDDAFGLAFDNENNIVYADANKLVRLKLNLTKKCNK